MIIGGGGGGDAREVGVRPFEGDLGGIRLWLLPSPPSLQTLAPLSNGLYESAQLSRPIKSLMM